MASTATDRVSQIIDHLAQVTPSLKDKVCIVTGAGSTHGIGRATAFALAKRGPKAIYVTDLGMDNLEELAKEIERTYAGVECIPYAVDAASDSAVTGIIEQAMSKYGRLDVFFANAGVATGDRLRDETAESFMRMMRINALSCFLAIKHAGAAMSVTGKGGKEFSSGSIICTASGKYAKIYIFLSSYKESKNIFIHSCWSSFWCWIT
ncbi:hypothetical protein HPULCUR_002628 [Helicostylum pulchrum]|uniref:NAD(P)-binding protein n=1 Tax=Helicostylum pulchrum TaxID=562976 RepID=A0ABP9XR55_9FUNG